jgi:hypothetical protein
VKVAGQQNPQRVPGVMTWGRACLPMLILLGSCSNDQVPPGDLPAFTLSMCSGKLGWQSGESLDNNAINVAVLKLEDSVGPSRKWDVLKKTETVVPWKQYIDNSIFVAVDAGVHLKFFTDAKNLGLSNLSDVLLVPGSRVGIILSVGSPRLNTEENGKWKNYFSPQNLTPPVFSDYSIRSKNGAWRFFQELDRYKKANAPSTFFVSPENLWRCNVSQIENPINNEDWISCEAFYPSKDAVLTVVFQRSLICHTPEIATNVEAFLVNFLKS